LLENLLYNEKRQKDSVKFFEISDIYFSKKDSSISRNIAIIASGRLGLNYEDFSRKINKNYFEKIFKEILPNQTFDFNIISREQLDTKINSEIISLEININSISSEILSYKELSTPPERFNQYSQISEHPSSFKDISYSIKDYGKTIELQELLLNYKNDIIQHVYIFDYYKNEKKKEIKIGFRFIFQAKKTTLTSLEIDEVYDEILKSSLKIKGVTIPGLL
jgi:phenylalanyl-tRNA synthetase beta subunit